MYKIIQKIKEESMGFSIRIIEPATNFFATMDQLISAFLIETLSRGVTNF